MEEPLLAALVTDEAEAAITHEPFDSACRHGALLHVAGLALQYQQLLRKNRAFRSVPRARWRCTMPVLSRESCEEGCMGRAHLTAVAAAAAFGLASVIIAAQAPAQPPAGQKPAPAQAGQTPQPNTPPVPADPTQPQGQGRGGSPMQAARADIKGANG